MTEESPDHTKDLLPQVPETLPEDYARDQNNATSDLHNLVHVDSSSDGLSESSMATSLQNFVDVSQRRNGIGALFSIYAAWATEDKRRFDLQCKQNLEAQNKAEEVSKQLTDAKVEISSLKAVTSEQDKIRPLVNVAFVCGPIVFGIGLEQIGSDRYGIGIALLLMGSVFVLAAFFVSRKGGQA